MGAIAVHDDLHISHREKHTEARFLSRAGFKRYALNRVQIVGKVWYEQVGGSIRKSGREGPCKGSRMQIVAVA
jgi:hypothetical protein